MKPLAPKTSLQNRYEITRLIGKGGMGEVYLAIDTRLGHSIALKRTTVGDDAILAEAFEQEARTLAQLRHNVLPKVSDHFVESTGQFLVMEYIEGEDLSERLKTTADPFPLSWVLFWADQLLEALEYLHKHDPPIIHRDIKPQNLKLTPENQIILLDFGLSKRTTGDTQVTSSGSVVGYTPHYAPMEQVRGTGTNARSDIYSLSATLYQLLTATIPSDALTRADAVLAGSADPLKPLTALNSEISESISNIILKGMEISQEKRYASARDMQKHLRSAFNELQSSMSADTVAFNINDTDISPADEKTEVISGLQIDEAPVVPDPVASSVPDQTPEKSVTPPSEDFSGDKTEVIDLSEVHGIANDDEYQSTMKKDFYPDELVGEEPEILKTEAYSGDEISSSTDGSIYETKENYKEIGDQSDAESTNKEEGFSPEATAPLISLDENVLDSGDGSSQADVTSDFGATDYNVDIDDASSPDTAEPEREVEDHDHDGAAVASLVAAGSVGGKSSTGRYVAILGGLGAILLLLVVSAAAIGWYVLNGGFGGDVIEEATPTPAPTVAETPVEDSTPEPANTDVVFDDSNSNSNSESNIAISNTESTESTPDATATPEITTTTKTPNRSSTPRPTRTRSSTPVKRPTRRPTKKPTRKPTPRPTKKPKSKDPGILQ